jgi:hypothetical protein
MLPFLLAMALEPLPTTAQTQEIAQANSVDQQNELPSSHPYASIKVGAGFPWNYNGSFDFLGSTIDTSLKLNGGFTGELALGYKWKQTRAEVAVGYGNYGVNNQTFNSNRYGSFSASSDGSMSLTTVMVNGYYDFPITKNDGSRSRWSPYIGAGIGYANLNVPSCSGDGCFRGGSTGGFAYQGNVGLSYRVSDRGQAFAETGFLGSTSGTIDDVSFGSFGSWRVFIGWRQGFGGSNRAANPAATQITPQDMPTPAPINQQQNPVRGLW